MKECLFDTNIISYFLDGHTNVVIRVSAYLDEYETLNIPDVVVYEILSGLYHKDKFNKAKRTKDLLLRECRTFSLTPSSIEISAQIYAEVRRTGKTIDDIDILIAGIAMDKDLILVTNNEDHFSRIPGLLLENWTK